MAKTDKAYARGAGGKRGGAYSKSGGGSSEGGYAKTSGGTNGAYKKTSGGKRGAAYAKKSGASAGAGLHGSTPDNKTANSRAGENKGKKGKKRSLATKRLGPSKISKAMAFLQGTNKQPPAPVTKYDSSGVAGSQNPY